MINAQFNIQLPEELWVAELPRQYPAAEFRLLSGYQMGDRALELGEVVADATEAATEAMRTHPDITAFELLESEPGRALAKYETTGTDLYGFAEISGLTIEFPVVVRNGWYSFDLTGTREELDELRALLEASPLSYELESLVTRTDTDRLLTERRREVLEAAVREGYFEVPRECALAELSDSLDADKSTVSTVIRRGEARLLKNYLSGPDSK